jgi:hypothetical protein
VTRDFYASAYRGAFEKEPGTQLPMWRNNGLVAKLNVPASRVTTKVLGKLGKTGDGKDMVVIGDYYFGFHPEKPGKPSSWSTTLEQFDNKYDYSPHSYQQPKPGPQSYEIQAGRTVTSFDKDEKSYFSFAKRFTIDSETYLNEPYMSLGGDADPSPWACAKVVPGHAYSVDGGYTFYALFYQGYDATSESAAKCRFGDDVYSNREKLYGVIGERSSASVGW